MKVITVERVPRMTKGHGFTENKKKPENCFRAIQILGVSHKLQVTLRH